MRKLFIAFLLLLPLTSSGYIDFPYIVDEKPQVLFSDSATTTTDGITYYKGLENYTYEYVEGYLRITFTYSHRGSSVQCCYDSYPPRIYVTSSDPRETSSPGLKDQRIIYQLTPLPSPPGHTTGWYLYDIQFDSTGYQALILQSGTTTITSFHADISGLTNSDYASLVRNHPDSQPSAETMAFTPRPIYYLEPVATTTPVIIVPGITGSKLSKTNGQEIWPNIPSVAISITDSHLDNLLSTESGESIQEIEYPSIIRGVSGYDFFDSLFSSLSSSGYEENTDSFEFPYDWRKSINDLSLDLKSKIDAVKLERGVDKVDLVAHSMGGLLVKKYLSDFGGDSVGKFVDIGTPHTGSPKSFKILNYGDDLGFRPLGISILNPDRIKSISQNMPSIYQLLPSREYFELEGSYILDVATNPLSPLLDYDETQSLLKSAGRNETLLDLADNLHQEIDGLDPSDYGVETYNIIGCGMPTLGQFYLIDNDPNHPTYNISFVNGDGTVPLSSAEALPNSSTYYVEGIAHATLPSTSGVRELIAHILTSTSTPNFDISPYSHISQSSSQCDIPDGKIVSFHSPITLSIYDSSGNHTGPNENGDIENNIPGVVYEVIDGNKFAFLPNNVNYLIEGEATEAGSFDIRIQEVVGGEVAKTTIYADIPLEGNSRTKFALGDNPPTEIALDSNGDGRYESNYLANDSRTNTTNVAQRSSGRESRAISPLPATSELNPTLAKNTQISEIKTKINILQEQLSRLQSNTQISSKPKNTNPPQNSITKSPKSTTNTASAAQSIGEKAQSFFKNLWRRLWSR